MKIDKLRDLTQTELKHKLDETRDQIFKLKIKMQTKQVENTAQLSGLRRDVARMKTLLKAQSTQPAVPAAAAPKR